MEQQVGLLKVSCGEGRYVIHIDAFTTSGRGLCAFIYGGERAHNGGTVIASPRMKSNAKHENDRTADVSISCVPGHKDTEAGVKVAKYLAVTLNEAVSLTCGIHIDHASFDEIMLLQENCMGAAKAFVEAYQK